MIFARIALLALAVLLPAAGSAQEARPRLQLLTRIGCHDCSGPQLFTHVLGIVVTHDRVYVLDATAPHVRVFDRSGRPLLTFGRQGDGPGEFRYPIHLNVRANGQFEVFDYGQGRFTRFSADGSQLTTRTIGFGPFPVLSSQPDNPDSYVVTSDMLPESQHILRLPPGDTAPIRLPPPVGLQLVVEDGIVRRPALAAHPSAGVAIGDGREEYRILLLRQDGTVAAQIERRIARIRKTQAEIQAERSASDRTRQQLLQRMRQRAPNANVPRPATDEYRRHFAAMAYDDLERLWVRTERGTDVTVFDVFGRRGQYLGEVVLPGTVGTFAVNDGIMAVMTYDQLGVSYVTLYSTTGLTVSESDARGRR